MRNDFFADTPHGRVRRIMASPSVHSLSLSVTKTRAIKQCNLRARSSLYVRYSSRATVCADLREPAKYQREGARKVSLSISAHMVHGNNENELLEQGIFSPRAVIRIANDEEVVVTEHRDNTCI